eukprot:6205030-Pleurochrysis_carterae.AAC.1
MHTALKRLWMLSGWNVAQFYGVTSMHFLLDSQLPAYYSTDDLRRGGVGWLLRTHYYKSNNARPGVINEEVYYILDIACARRTYELVEAPANANSYDMARPFIAARPHTALSPHPHAALTHSTTSSEIGSQGAIVVSKTKHNILFSRFILFILFCDIICDRPRSSSIEEMAITMACAAC